MTEPLPSTVTIVDPVIRTRRYLAVGVFIPGWITPRWHVWHADGSYAGYATDPALIDLVASLHEREHGR
ncbi:hypothetical protein GCM10010218_24550 [Streptomyces mashuensis]|uniref:Uncharacterized protein n=1 Tax=Streptomyces mashuensis TaxID=33904 RepID=A0A919B1M1_9ACTN|nr:hypothetical protein [Streptomyces mashuensis]GHF42489.1 hypothetical protein GCM10010218_24550 [Streptomyces mashuensis]